ncbi:MAG TPA: triose-phosphate isomerase [Candidatus Saccharimonadales bacterium]
MGKRTLIIGNWKMNLTIHEASIYVHKLDAQLTSHRNVEVVIAPGFLALPSLSMQINHRRMKLAAQNFYWRDEGTFTGEVSAHQLHGLVQYAIVGHSERRHVFGEKDKDIRSKVQAAVRNQITPVLCIGETAAERAAGETEAVLHDQITGGLANLTADEVEHIVIAYEPVWAISGGKDFGAHAVATPGDVAKAIKVIRRQVAHLFGKTAATELRVLYGGSISASNATGFMTLSDLDGFLVGGASLNAHEFTEVIKAAHNRSK